MAQNYYFQFLQINDEGADGFDLETLSTVEQVKGFSFFLALPHSDVQNAFDTMVSISGDWLHVKLMERCMTKTI